MKPLNRREKAAALAAAAALVLFAGDRFLYHPWREVVDGLQERVALRERGLRRASVLLARGDRLRREAAGRREGPARPADGVSLVKEVETLARLAGVKVRDLRREEDSFRAGRRPPAVSVTVETSWESLARFLHELHRSPTLLIEAAQLQAREESGAVSARLRLRGDEGGEA